MEILLSVHRIDTALQKSTITSFDPTNTSTLPFGGELVINPHADAYQQATQAFEQLGYNVAAPVYREEVVSNDPEQIELQQRDLTRRVKCSADSYKKLPSITPQQLELQEKIEQLERDLALQQQEVMALSGSTGKALTVKDGRAHIGQIEGLITNIHTGYQKRFGDIIKKSTEYMQDMNTAISKISSYMNAAKDGKVEFRVSEYATELEAIISKYSGKTYSEADKHKLDKDNKVLFNTSKANDYFRNWSPDLANAKPLIEFGATQSEYQFWKKKLDGQGFFVKYLDDKIKIHPDLKPVTEMYKTLDKSSASWDGKDRNIMVQEFQGIQTAFDAQKNAVNSSISRLLENFRQDNSHFDTLTQLLVQLIKDLNQYNNGLVNM